MFTVRAPAKINWLLKILDKRPDSYHNVISLMQKISFYDTIIFDISDEIEILSDLKIKKEDNLAYKAAVILRESFNIKNGAKIILQKYIPAEAGLGGGSSDAAATLLGLNKLWEMDLNIDALLPIAERLGSDVPFFLYNHGGIVEGKGERIREVALPIGIGIVVVKPNISISTAWAYTELDSYRQEKGIVHVEEPNMNEVLNAIRDFDFGRLSSITSNDFEEIIFEKFPGVSNIKERLRREGAVFSMLSGSGPAVFGVFENRVRMDKVLEKFTDCWAASAPTIA